MHPPPPAAGGAAAGRPGVLIRAQIGMAAAAAAFALFAFTLEPATFPDLPPMCSTSAREIMELRYRACLLLLCATAQAGAAAAVLVAAPPSGAGRFLAFLANLLGLSMLGHLALVVLRVLFAAGVFCLAGHLLTFELIVYAVLAYMFLLAIPTLWFLGY